MNHGVLLKISIFFDVYKFITSQIFVFRQFLFFPSLKFFKYYPISENVVPLKISSYSVTFVSKDCAFILNCRKKKNTEPKRFDTEK